MEKTAKQVLEAKEIIRQLRDPEKGCPWDLKQTHESLRQYLIEECYETIDAIENGEGLEEELGDVFLQILLHCQLAEERGEFSLGSMAEKLSKKLIKRHPHVFGDAAAKDAEAVVKQWEKIKLSERSKNESVLDGVPSSLPALLKAMRIGEKVGRLGFDWESSTLVLDKVIEELEELKEALKVDKKSAEEELGDLLFSLAQWARKAGIDPEESLNKTNRKFTARFKKIEESAEKPLNELTKEDWEALWVKAKAASA